MSTEAKDKPLGFRAWYTAILLMVIYLFAFLDRSLPSILMQSIKADLALSDTQVGLLSGVMFALLYSIMGFPMAALIDRFPRRFVLGGAILLWSSVTCLAGFAANFWQYALSRLGVAVGEAACGPAAQSIIGTSFPARFRGRAFALYFIGAPIGTLLGLMLGGLINELANWRLAMFALGAPGGVLALLAFFTLREDRVRAAERRSSPDAPAVAQVIGVFFGNRGLLHLMVGMVLTAVSMSAVGAFAPLYFIREFHKGTAAIGASYGLAVGVAGVAGTVLGGWIADRFGENRHLPAMSLVAVLICLGAASGLAGLVWAPSYALLLACIFPMQIVGTLQGPAGVAAMQRNLPPRMYAVSAAIHLFAFNGIGLSLGPLIAGAISDHFAARGPAGSLHVALCVMTLPAVWGAGHFARAAFLLRDPRRQDPEILSCPVVAV